MHIELARTFLEIVSTGSFINAADGLHVAQTTVSARLCLCLDKPSICAVANTFHALTVLIARQLTIELQSLDHGIEYFFASCRVP
jgi:hypothetical protein